MQSEPFNDLVSEIYEAALDESHWSQVVRKLAKIVDSGQASFEFHDHLSGTIVRQAPLTDPAFIQSFPYYQDQFSLHGRTARLPVGRVVRGREFLDYEWLGRSEYFNEWWKPQGVGGDSLFVNLAMSRDAAVVATICKHFGRNFSAAEERAFAAAAGHMARAVSIHSRMHLAGLARAPTPSDMPAGMLLVTKDSRILHGDEEALGLLEKAGLLDPFNRAAIASPDRAIERLVRAAASSAEVSECEGACEYRRRDGPPLQVTVFPCRAENGIAAAVAGGRPAALIQVATGEERARARIDRLVRKRGLTPAEAAVAVEIARGDGRAAAAARLGIRETTVRSHLSAIFDKLGIHRQAELTRLVGEC